MTTVTRKSLRVLLIEDDADDAELVVLHLERGGLTVECKRVASARELRAALTTPAWDVAISDYGMPGFDAPSALAIVREYAPDLPFIIVSGSVGEELVVQALKAGAQDFFLKNRLERLANAVEREVGEARLRAERKEALERLRASEERLKALVEQAIVGIAHVDLQGRFSLVNQKYAEMTGRTVAELLTMGEQDVTHPNDQPAAAPFLAADREQNMRSYVVEKRYVRPNGSHIWVNANVSVLSDARGRDSGIVMVVEDVTDRRRTQRERERLVNELAQTVKVSEMFAGVLGHDLRNPLMTITMGATLLARRGSTIGSQEMGGILTRMVRSSDRMRRMIDQLLDFTRIRMGNGIPLVTQRVDLVESVRQVIDEIAGGAHAEPVRLEIRGDCVGEWDHDRLLQLVSNLVANAVHHREPDSEVIVRVDGESEAAVRLEVENRGVIPPAILPAIFEPMQTTKAARRDRASGLGLGLFITRQIARAHGGAIAVDSTPENGTRFTVDLPRAIPESGTQRQPSSFEVPVASVHELVPGSDDCPTRAR